MRLQHLSIALFYVLSYIQTLAAPFPGPNTDVFNPADFNSDLAAIYSDAYRKTLDAYENEYQRLYNEYINYLSAHYPYFKIKRSDISINEDSDIIKPTRDATSSITAVTTD